jgi:hypothetical protein
LDSLSQYIEQQREAGTVESAGSFTLAIEKARDKLSTYSLANSEDYILKVVQCAVILGVKKLHIRLTRTTVLAYFELAEEDTTLSVENLTSSLLTPLEEKDRARSHLALALCSIAGQQPTELMWGDWNGRETNIILSLGHGRSELFRSVPFPRTEPLDEGRRLHLLFLKKSTSGKLPLSQTTKEAAVLLSRCSFAPLEVELEGTNVGPSLPIFVSSSDPVKQLSSLYLGAFSIISAENKRLHWNPAQLAGANQAFKKELPRELKPVAMGIPPAFILERPQHWTLPIRAEVHFSEVFGIPNYLYGPSSIFYIKDGVMLNALQIHDAGGGAFAVLNGEHCKTDLTGLQVVRDESVETDIDRTVKKWTELVNQFVDGHPPVYQASLVSSSEDAIYYLFGCCLLGPFAQLFKPLYDYFSQRKRKKIIQAKRFHRQLSTRRGYLAYFRKQKD